MTYTIEQLIARWNTNEGKPFKGSLVDMSQYEKDNRNLGCMCAQGQALHLIGGLDVLELDRMQQSAADRQCAKLLNISVAHSVLLRTINDKSDGAPSIVLTNPELVIGDQAQTILAFWRHLDTMTKAQWDAAWAAAGDAAGAAAGDAAGATAEIQGAAIMRERGQPFFFLPAFGFATPEDILK